MPDPDHLSACPAQVDFLIAGVQKAGTTTLWQQCRRMPGLFLPEPKELHFFDNEAIDWEEPDYGSYHHRFAAAPAGTLWGEATPIYLFWPEALERIRRYNPAIRLILVFRDPIDRAVSHWRMETGRGKETRPLGTALRDEGHWPGSPLSAEMRLRCCSYVARGFYGRQLEHALSLFPREQMLLLATEDVWTRPADTMERIARFLGVTPPAEVEPVWCHRSEGPSASLTGADFDALRDRLAPDLRRFKALSGLDLAGWPTLANAPA